MINFKNMKWYGWLLLAVVIILVPLGGFLLLPFLKEKVKTPFTGSDQTRGKRNNNPMNLRQTDINWRGESKEDLDPEFEEFDSMMLGVRAGLRNMRTWFNRGNKNLEKLISIWAPDHENDTNSYIEFMERETGLDRNEDFEWTNEAVYPIAKAMCQIESLFNLERSLYDEAWNNID